MGVSLLVVLFLALTAAAVEAQQLSIDDVTQAETNAATTTFTFTVTLSAPAGGPSGVTFDIATANGTAIAGEDYVHRAIAGATIGIGGTSFTFDVTVNGDSTPEANQTFFVNVTNVVGATLSDGQGVGTITNDDVPLTPIHDIQGPGASSPIVSSTVFTRGVVTARTADGFFMQEPDATVDADPATSEGIFVRTVSAPPADAAVSALVQVQGLVVEFVPSSDPFHPPVTMLWSPTVDQLLPPGQALPTPVTLTLTFPDPAGPHDQLERAEGMRVTATSLTVVGPTEGSLNESTATATSSGRFYAVLTGHAPPAREAGIQAPDPPPLGSIPPIPRWDQNPERISVDTTAAASQPAIDLRTGDVAGAFTGPLDYRQRVFTILAEDTSAVGITPRAPLTTTITAPAGSEATVASINLRSLYDTVDDAYADTVLTGPAYIGRLARASLAIRTHLRNPDIIGVQEVESLSVLQDLATRIAFDGGATYAAYLVDGNDAGGLDVGFLVKTDLVPGGVPRVSVTSVTQQGETTLWTDPADNQLRLLNDRPPLVLEAEVFRTAAASFPLVVIVTDLRDRTSLHVETPDGFTTVGRRAARKRQAQAEFLANYIQSRLTATPGEHLVVLGSFNAFEFNDGFVDVVNVVAGTPPPDNQTSVPGDGVDLVTPDLVNLVSTPAPSERYGQIVQGDRQNVDHVLVAPGLIADTRSRRIEYARIAADYHEVDGNDGSTALRFSDRDPVVAFIAAPVLELADVQITNVAAPDPALAGQPLAYTISVANAGPDAATLVSLSDTLPAGTTFLSLTSPAGWSCTTPAVGAAGTVSCSIASMAVGTATFTLSVQVPAAATGMITNVASVTSSTLDPSVVDNSASSTVAATAQADLSVLVTGASGPVAAGQTVTFTTTFASAGPSQAQTVAVSNPLAAWATFVSATVDSGSGWTLTAPAAGASGAVIFSKAVVSPGETATFTVVAQIGADTTGGTLLTPFTAASATPDPTPGNNVVSVPTTVDGRPSITAISDVTIVLGAAPPPRSFTVGDLETPVNSLLVTATSSNVALVPNSALELSGTGANRSISVAPLPGQTGATTITVTVSDGALTASTTFVVTVTEPPPLTYFLAEGATGDFFDEDLLIANPNTDPAPVTVTFYREGQPSITESRTIAGRSGVSIRVDDLPGLEAAAASVLVTSTGGVPLAVERTQLWGVGSYGGATETALPAPSAHWHFAEGAQGHFETFVLVANPQASPADITLRFLREGETETTTQFQVAPFSRATVPASAFAALESRSFAIIVEASAPVVAERAMYFGSTASRPWSGGAAAAGATAPAATWYFAEGATGAFFDTFVLLMNPDAANPANVTLRYLLDTGETVDVPKVVPPRGRLSVNVEAEDDARLHAAAMAIRVTADRPIVAERSIYWATGEGAQPWGESHTSQGAIAAAPRWALAEGRSGGALNFHTYVLLGNPGPQPAEVSVQFVPESGAPIARTYVVPAASRFTVDVSADAPGLDGQRFITFIDTTDDVPIVVERSMYWDGAGITWSGGSNAIGTRVP